MGPAPTAGIGNGGPLAQAPERAYGVRPGDGPGEPGGWIEFGRWFGLAGRKRIAVERVVNVAFGRVVVDVS